MSFDFVYGYIPKYFIAEELVDPKTFAKIGKWGSFNIMDSRIIWTIDKIREQYGSKITINNWKWGGQRKYSGYRPVDSNMGAKFSQHKFGRAIDFIMEGVDASSIRADILANPEQNCFKYISAIEDFNRMGWVHIDVRNIQEEERIKVFGK